MLRAPLNRSAALTDAVKGVLDRTLQRRGRVGPALYGGVIKADGTFGAAAVGVRNSTTNDAAQVSDPVHLGSMTKAMTARLVSSLVSDSAQPQKPFDLFQPRSTPFSWKTSVASVFPELGETAMGSATMEMLLDHSSGFRDDKMVYGMDLQTLHGWLRTAEVLRLSKFRGAISVWRPLMADWASRASGKPVIGPQELVQLRSATLLNIITQADKDFHRRILRARGDHNYSNFGVGLGAAVCERLTGLPFEALLVRRVAEPLGMTSLGFGEPKVAFGHTHSGWIRPKFAPMDETDHVVPKVLTAAGDVHCSVEDHLKFLLLELQEASSHDPATRLQLPQYLNPCGPMSALAKRLHYRRGWMVTRSPPKSLSPTPSAAKLFSSPHFNLCHNGSNGVWYGFCTVVPDLRCAAVCVTNASTFHTPGALGGVLNQLARAAMDHASN